MTLWQQREVVHCIRSGGIVAYPTEAVYGLGCDPHNAESVYRLLALKQRSVNKGLILLASDLEQLLPYLAPLDQAARKTLLKTWPGPHTWVIPANPAIPQWINGQHNSVAVRVTAHPIAKAICDQLQHPIISTSANLSGHPATRNVLQLRKAFPTGIDYIISGGTSLSASATPITDLESGKIIRS